MDPNPVLDERTKKSFDLVADITRQIITLSTAIIAAVVTFFDKISSASLHSGSLKFVMCGYLISVVCGLFTFMALAGNVARAPIASPYAGNIRAWGALQIVFFLAATAAIIILVGW